MGVSSYSKNAGRGSAVESIGLEAFVKMAIRLIRKDNGIASRLHGGGLLRTPTYGHFHEPKMCSH